MPSFSRVLTPCRPEEGIYSPTLRNASSITGRRNNFYPWGYFESLHRDVVRSLLPYFFMDRLW
jgi:hypothetical protein